MDLKKGIVLNKSNFWNFIPFFLEMCVCDTETDNANTLYSVQCTH